ncbi:unnamed protein product [Schistosoma turkestanicum]|nr:unnamed protein product [Schistosoma turkestanicum]
MQDIYTNIQRPIEENCIAFVSRETLRGIEYMHKAGKIHRDIKGANILLTNDGDVKIADFGVAAQITQTIQRRNSFIGTPYWMAPEVAAVERKGGYDEKCDVWALGITAIEYAELQPPLFDLHPMRYSIQPYNECRNNKLWICMEFCGGFSMQDIYTNIQRPIEENCIAFVSRETLRGIEYMHKAGKIHRDIKGANILLTNDGDVKIADFGVAAQITQTIQRRNSFIGTPYWMAPEVAAVERKGGYDEKCDVWALGITAIEYAELQPPLFDLHPMRALRILGMRSYKPPVLRNKSLWSQKFHNFLKASLTKSEKKRPTAQALLRHEFVNQPHLTRLLTLKLLETNRNPDIVGNNNNNNRVSPSTRPANDVINQPKSNVVTRPAEAGGVRQPQHQQQQEYSALLAGRPDYPMVMNKSPVPLSPSEECKSSQTSIENQSPSSHISSSDIKRTVSSTSSSSASNRPEPLRKMHTPWQSQLQQIKSQQSSPITISKPSTTIAEVIVQKSSIITPMERIQSARPQQFLIEHSIIHSNNNNNDKPHSTHHPPCTSKSILEEIRIMDELPTPFPAYVASAPTATPALKPPGLNYHLNHSTSKHIEHVIQKMPTSSSSSYSSSVIVTQPLHTQVTKTSDDLLLSTNIVVSHKNGHHLPPAHHHHHRQQQHQQHQRRSSSNNSSSISSASTSPRSSCSSSQLDLLDPVSTDLTSESRQTTILSNSSTSSPNSPGSTTTTSSSSSASSTTSSVSTEAAVGDDEGVRCKTDTDTIINGNDEVVNSVVKQHDIKEGIQRNNNHQDCLSITEHTIIQDSLEARFLPIDNEPHVVESHTVQVTHHNVNHENADQFNRLTDSMNQNVVIVVNTLVETPTTTTITSITTDNHTTMNSLNVKVDQSIDSINNQSNNDKHNISKSMNIVDNGNGSSSSEDYSRTTGKHRTNHHHRPQQVHNRRHSSFIDYTTNHNHHDVNDVNEDIVHYTPPAARLSPMSFNDDNDDDDDRGTVTTIDSHLSSIAAHDEELNYSPPIKQIDTDSKNITKSPPYACLDMHDDDDVNDENPDEWDLDVADRDLLATDGLLYLDRSHPVRIILMMF